MSDAAGSAEPGPEPFDANARRAKLERLSRSASEREAAAAALRALGRKRARLLAGAWVAVAAEGAARAFWAASGQPALSLALLGITVLLALQLAAGVPAARWAAVLFTSARGLVGLQWAERLADSGARPYLLSISLAYLVIAAVLLFDKAIAQHCRAPLARRA